MRHPDEVASLPVAIIGMACRLPGADNLEQFWRLLVEGRSAIGEIPSDRLNEELYYHPKKGVRGKTYSKLTGVISSRQFDHQACPIPPELAKSVDNVHLLMCEVAAAACRNARLDPFQLSPRNTGVYIGHAQGSDLAGEYTYATCVEEAAQFLRKVEGFEALDAKLQDDIIRGLVEQVRGKLPHCTADMPDLGASMVAGTISKAFGLSGPFLAINSACASSLHALLVASRALQLGRIDMAIVGGASDCKTDSLVLFSHAQAMSPTGSRPFDEDADGLVCSEGYVAVVLKTLDRALADGDPIHAVIRGMGISSDGKGKSLWAPRKEGQIKAMQRAYRVGIDISSLQYLEGHATATQLGDATELNTLAEVLREHLPAGRKISIGSVKANIGHSLETAGIAGLIKTVLAMQHETIPPAINIRKLNPKIDWDNVPVHVPTSPMPWPEPGDGKPRCSGVNAFGIGGLNMHVVVEQFTEATRERLRVTPPSARPQASPNRDDEAIAVLGLGCVLPGALNIPAYRELLISGRDPKQPVPPGRWRTDLAYRSGSHEAYRSCSRRGGFITDFEYDWRTHKVPPKQIAQADPLQFMLLDAVDQAMSDAGYNNRPFDRTRVGVVVGTEFGGDFAFQLQMGLRLPDMGHIIQKLLAGRGVSSDQSAKIAAGFSETLLKEWPALIDESGSFSTSSLASRISKSWNLMGGAVAIDCGSASSTAALSICVDGLLGGDCDMMICAAGQRRMGLPTYESLSVMGIVPEHDAARSPFDAQFDGYLPGEGVGVVLLKRLADAERDGDRIHCIIRGIGAAHSDDWGEALRTAIERSLEVSSLSPNEISVVEIDSCGKAEFDSSQHQALASTFSQTHRNAPLLVSTAVTQIGHTVGASGMVSLIKSSLELEDGMLPGGLGIESPVPALTSAPQALQIPQSKTPIAAARPNGRRVAGVCSTSRTLAYHMIIEQGAVAAESNQSGTPAVPASVRDDTWRICRIGASTAEQLMERVGRLAADPDRLFAASASSRFQQADRVRLAIVADDPASLQSKLDIARKQLFQPSAREVLRQRGIFCHELGKEIPRIALLFVGQGSQYANMMRPLTEQLPAARAAMLEADAAMKRQGLKTFAEMAWDDASQLGSDIWTTQASILIADSIMLAALNERGIKPALVAGHSYGEYAALLAAGVWNLDEAIRVTRARCAGIEAMTTERGGMLATNATPDVLEQLLPQVSPQLFIANHNAPEQTVVGGADQALSELAAVLEGQSYHARRIPVPCAFHTPLLKHATGPLAKTLAEIQIAPPSIPVWSLVTNRPVSGASEIRENLVAHMTSPVRYVDLIQTIASEKPTVLIEVGPQQALTRLHDRILQGHDTLAIASDNPNRPGLEQLCSVQALLECTGAWQPIEHNATPVHKPVASPAVSIPTKGAIVHFDATAPRRERMRQAARSPKAASRIAEPPTATSRFAAPAAPSVRNGDANGTAALPSNGDLASGDLRTPHVSDTAKAGHPNGLASPPARPIEPVLAQETAPAGIDVAQLETFLINFVVEQTGYPTEVVELDADLEGDLAIDSIKKAQLFGELQEYFDLTPSDDLTLDDFPTLRHVLNFLKGSQARLDVAESAPTAISTVHTSPAPVPAPQAEPSAGVDAAQLESFLINFVVEQTGYPTEVVELDADLEGDLAIDSIKKAQLFGELQEYFDLTPSDDLTLDDFPTLRHVLNFLIGSSARQEFVAVPPSQSPHEPELSAAAQATRTSAPASATQANGVDAAQLESFLINFVVEQTGYPTEVVELDADLEGDLAIDSIKKAQLFGELQEYFDLTPSDDLTLDDFPTLRHVLNFLLGSSARQQLATATPESSTDESQLSAAPESPGVDAAQLESFLINFVVEQTGYPTEVVELDADLEGDLAIDSIKKAQLFGELQEYFDIAPSDDLTLDDFPTLRHVLDFLLGNSTRSNTPAMSPSSPSDNGAYVAPAASPQSAAPVLDGQADENNPAYQRGQSYGLQYRTSIQQELRDFADLPESELEDPASTVRKLEELRCALHDDEQSELRGIACAVEVPFGNILAYRLRKGPLAASSHPSEDAVGEDVTDIFDDRHAGDEIASDDWLTQRYVMRIIHSPFQEGTPREPQWNGAALIVGGNPTATALRRRLERSGVTVRELPISDNLDETLQAFEQIWQEQPTPHLFLTTPRDSGPADPYDEASWQHRRYRSATVPFFLCQKWVQLATKAGILDRCTLVGLTSLGGDFGFSRNVGTVDSGAMSGLLKAIYIEFNVMQRMSSFRVAVIDSPENEPPDWLAENVCRELASGANDYEVSYVNGHRCLQNSVPKTVETDSRCHIRRGGVWVVTGGARGITAACSRELAQRFGLRLHLIGSSARPQIDPAWRHLSSTDLRELKSTTMKEARDAGQSMNEAWERVQKAIEIDRSLQDFSDAGIDAQYHQCNVADRSALANVLDRIRRTHGSIDGIIHGAGIDQSCRYERKQADVVEATIGSKTDGARHLMELTRDDRLSHFITFGSVSGRLGSNGQTDYCLSSDFLAKLIDWYRAARPDVRSVCLHWHPWDEVGMAARPESRAALSMGVSPELMPKREGLKHFMREVCGPVAHGEVLITTREYYRRYYGENDEGIQDAASIGFHPPAFADAEPAATDAPLPGNTKFDEPLPIDERTAHRAVLRSVDAPLSTEAASAAPITGPAWILGDNAESRALEMRLKSMGIAVSLITPREDADQVLAEMEQLWQTQPARNLFVMTARDPEAASILNQVQWQHRKAVGVILPYLVTQRWCQLLAKDAVSSGISLLAATALGGDFGCSKQVAGPEGGALTGLLKSLHIEEKRRGNTNLRVKIVDAPSDEPPDELAEAICRELGASEPDVEVGWSRGRRTVIKAIAQSSEELPRENLPRGATWIVTGGARGITAAVAYVLGRRYAARIHIIGSSPAPNPDAPWQHVDDDQLKAIKAKIVREAVSKGVSPEEDWVRVKKEIEIQENLERFEEAGVSVTYHECDVSDWDALAAVLQQVRETDGPPDVVIHGAGYAKSGRFEDKSRKHLLRTIESKVDGAVALMALTKHDPVRLFVGFGSISGRFGGNGLSDYAAANDMLAKLMVWHGQQKPDCGSACIHWQSWDEVGMAMIPDSSLGAKGVLKMDFIHPREGVDHLHQEMRAGLTEGEVLIDDGYFYKTFYPELAGRDAVIPAAQAATKNGSAKRPLLDQILSNGHPGDFSAQLRFDPTTDPFLIEHRLNGRRYLPGVIALEAMAEAASQQGDGKSVLTLRDVEIVNGLPFYSDNPVTAKVTATGDNGSVRCTLSCERRDRQGRIVESQRTLTTGTVELGDAQQPHTVPAPGTPPLGWHEYQYPDEGLMYHGPPFRTLKECAFSHGGGWGKIVAPPLRELARPRAETGWILPTAVLDGCVVACGSFVYIQFEGALEVPHGFDMLRIHRMPRDGETCILKFSFVERMQRHTTFDFTLVGEDNSMIVEARGYRTILVNKGGA